jgi:UDP-N-acetylmuramoyl-tripeptide--D-alanyl-D-alanine ligase
MFDMNFATSVPGWILATAKILLRSLGKANYDMLVIEIGTDYPGELQSFAWLRPDVGVLTAIAPEHMEQFKTIEAVAKEELSIVGFCKRMVLNGNMVDRKFLVTKDVDWRETLQQAVWYGDDKAYGAINYRIEGTQVLADCFINGQRLDAVALQVLGKHSLDALAAAAAVGVQCDMQIQQVKDGIQAVEPVKGRMQRLNGINDAVIIDDSYNASPDAVKAALDVLGQFDVPQRIAVLGMMNEMGDYSPQAHREVGAYCDPSKLDLVVTIGADANEYLAAAAKERGCRVECFTSPYDAGAFVKQQLIRGAALLFKGSQNGVFAEEAIKSVLADPEDVRRLVRQSEFWMARKRQQFGGNTES